MDQIQTAKQLSSFTALLRGAWSLFSGRFKTLAAIILPPIAAMGALSLWVSFGISPWVYLAALIAVSVLQLISELALIKAISVETGFSDAYKYALKNFFPYLWLIVLASVVIMGGLLLGFIPGVIFSVWFALSVYILVVENQKGMDALVRGREYVRGYWWNIFWKLTLASLLLSVLLSPLLWLLDKVGGAIAGLIVFALGYLAGAFLAVFIYRLYQDVISVKPEMAVAPVGGKRGWFIFAAILGFLLAANVLWILLRTSLAAF